MAQSLPGPRTIEDSFTRRCTAWARSSVCPVLAAAGFKDVEVFKPQAEPDGDFPNVPGHVVEPRESGHVRRHDRASPAERRRVDPVDRSRRRPIGMRRAANIALGAPWRTFTGNQIGALLAEYVLAGRKAAGTLSSDNYVVKTLVTSEMIRRIADAYGVKTYGNLLVGFKWIAQTIDEVGPEKFVLGCEESHGFLVGTHVRDKDAAVAAMLMAELAAQCKAAGQTLSEKLDALYWQHGCHAEKTVSKTMPGSEGMTRMKQLMTRLRTELPESLAGIKVWRRAIT